MFENRKKLLFSENILQINIKNTTYIYTYTYIYNIHKKNYFLHSKFSYYHSMIIFIKQHTLYLMLKKKKILKPMTYPLEKIKSKLETNIMNTCKLYTLFYINITMK